MSDLLILSQDFPPDIGGTQTYAIEIARRMVRNGRVRVIAPQRPGSESVDSSLPCEVVRVPGGHSAFGLMAVPEVRSAISQGFRRIFCVQWSSAVAAFIGKVGLPPTEIHLAAHGRELLFNPLPFPVGRPYDFLRREVVRGVTAVYPVSRYTAGLVRDLGVPAERVHVVPNGTDPHRFQPVDGHDARRRLGFGARPIILTLCRLVPRKGVDTVLKAVSVLKEELADVLLVVAGDGAERAWLEQLTEDLGLHENVRFLGTVPYEGLPDLFSAADVFALVPREVLPDVEGFGLVYLEAGACGLPVIGSRTGGIPDAVLDGVTGLLVAPDDPEATAAALHFLLSDRTVARTMGEAARDHVLEWGNWDRVVERLGGHFASSGG